MALFQAIRVKVATTTDGLDDFGIGAAPNTSFQDFTGAGVTDGAEVDYVAWTDTEFEAGTGTYDEGGSTLSRDVIDDSSDGGAKVDFGSSPMLAITFLPKRLGSGSAETTRVVVSGDVTVADDDVVIVINKTSGSATAVTLPTAVDFPARGVTIKDGKGDADTNNITVSPDGSETLDGASSVVLNFSYQAQTFRPYPDGSGWFLT